MNINFIHKTLSCQAVTEHNFFPLPICAFSNIKEERAIQEGHTILLFLLLELTVDIRSSVTTNQIIKMQMQ